MCKYTTVIFQRYFKTVFIYLNCLNDNFCVENVSTFVPKFYQELHKNTLNVY